MYGEVRILAPICVGAGIFCNKKCGNGILKGGVGKCGWEFCLQQEWDGNILQSKK